MRKSQQNSLGPEDRVRNTINRAEFAFYRRPRDASFKFKERGVILKNRDDIYSDLNIPRSRVVFAATQMSGIIKFVDATDGGLGTLSADDAPQCDGLFTYEMDLALVIAAGDCVILLIYVETEDGRVLVGNIHVSRLNLHLILPEIIRIFAEQGVDIPKVRIIVAPAIRPESYRFHPDKRDVIANQLEQSIWTGFITQDPADKYYVVDVPGCCKNFFVANGLENHQWIDYGINTANPKSGFYSNAHKEETGEGRHAIVIVRRL
ncbi:MAG: laccase domain-containing protein [Patescibacteria group bacterium]|nr:laccase domain-containing protein [Patescibacteria group bacterium]